MANASFFDSSEVKRLLDRCDKIIIPDASALLHRASSLVELFGDGDKGLNFVIITDGTAHKLEVVSGNFKNADRRINANYILRDILDIQKRKAIKQENEYSLYSPNPNTILCFKLNGSVTARDSFLRSVKKIKSDLGPELAKKILVIVQKRWLLSTLLNHRIQAEALSDGVESETPVDILHLQQETTDLTRLHYYLYKKREVPTVRPNRIRTVIPFDKLKEFNINLDSKRLRPNIGIHLFCETTNNVDVLLVYKVNRIKDPDAYRYEDKVEICDPYLAVVNLPQPKKEGEFEPANVEQAIAEAHIIDPTILFMMMTGGAGTGKTTLVEITYAKSKFCKYWNRLKDKMNYSKLLIFKPRNPDLGSDDNEESLGALPGDTNDKMSHFIKIFMDPLIQQIKLMKIKISDLIDSCSFKKERKRTEKNGSEESPNELIYGEGHVSSIIKALNISVEPLLYLGSLNIYNTLVLINEAQTVGFYRFNQAVTRIADGSKMIIEGDVSLQKGESSHIGLTAFDIWIRASLSHPTHNTKVAFVHLKTVVRGAGCLAATEIMASCRRQYE